MQLCKLETMPSTHSQPMYISHCIVIKLDFMWEIFVNGHHVEHDSSTLFSGTPPHLESSDAITKLVTICDSAYICHGYPKRDYLAYAELHKGVFRNKNGEVRAQIDSTHPVMMKGEMYQSTIRTTECAIIADSPLCDKCKDFGPVLRSTYSRWQGTSCNEISKFTNNRYLTSPQKQAKLKQLQERVTHERKERIALTERIEKLTSADGIEVESSFHQDLFSIMQENNSKIASQFPDGTFRRLFWDQQFQAALKKPKQMRWHPTMIRLIFVC